MMGWCPYDGEECRHDGWCEDCVHYVAATGMLDLEGAIDILERDCDFHHSGWTDECRGCLYEKEDCCNEKFHDALIGLLKSYRGSENAKNN